ncbi:putative leucine-rich repeat protein (LRRP) [Trypanosoma rangeli]|uniref:Putative leucine-rich repeat protein (LRRP) n=1 Tax=Trypanosoma rangeli TaxID=5698 RepID=A0A3R7L7Y9_TRYRA|nr:putative leucine-rich repeat protein (LRRP) [Trypanosoma rangeli]RNF09469.1 putative leucine-rich repeat protein (LRRP) [Trypanosoma rangeli]|eukprot:RNF09469.1 putative leucine-rich repeat protein (LRRP) [Trypanosoma rangeli]
MTPHSSPSGTSRKSTTEAPAQGSAWTSNAANEEMRIQIAWTRMTPEMCKEICRTIVNSGVEVPLRVVDLIDNQLGPEQTQKIASVLESSTVRDVLLRYNDIGKEGCDALANFVNVSTKLQLLDIRGNALTAGCVRKLLKSISMSTPLTRLGLSANKIGQEGAVLLLRALEKNAYLTSLDISLNEIGPSGAQSIAQLLVLPASPLKTLQLYGNHLGCSGVVAIATAVKKNKFLKDLTLGNNNATDASTEALAEMLRENSTLESLDLRSNTLTAAGVRNLARDGLAHNTFLVALSLSDNPIGSVGGDEIAKTLIMHQGSALATLDLSSCDLGSTGGMRIASLIAATITLNEVNLSDNKLDNEAAVVLARSIVNSISISIVDLSANEIGEWGASNLIDATQLNSRISSLILHGNHINRVVQKKIDTLLGDRISRNRVQEQQASLLHPR